MAAICVDSVFLLALYTPRDQHHALAVEHFQSLFSDESMRNSLVVPWPILYESLNTRLARRTEALEQLSRDWAILNFAGRLSLRSDESHREQALREQLEVIPNRTRALSLVDRVLRSILSSEEAGIDAFLTYNSGDFADACALHGVTLIDQHVDIARLDLA
jgi:predicted nucleic acid-binding protein